MTYKGNPDKEPNRLSELVSIIIPCFNYGHLIEHTLNSLLEQEHQNWEAIIIDDGSVDDTRQIVEAFVKQDSRFKYYFQENSGVSAARNHGLRMAKGCFIQFLDADDLLSVHKISRQIGYFLCRSDLDVCYCEAHTFASRDERTAFPNTYLNDNIFNNICQIINQNVVISSPLFKRTLITDSMAFNPKITYNEDWEFWMRLITNGARFHFVNDPLCYTLIRIHGNNSSANRMSMLIGELQIKKGSFAQHTERINLDALERTKLKRHLKTNINNLYKQLFFDAAQSNRKKLQGIYPYFGLFKFISYYLKFLNYKRKQRNRP